jgi:hypothetical protein
LRIFRRVNLEKFIRHDEFLTCHAARLTRAQHLEALWAFSGERVTTPLDQLIDFDVFLAWKVSHWPRERRLAELWSFLRLPPYSDAPNRPPDRPVAGQGNAFRLLLDVGGWEN